MDNINKLYELIMAGARNNGTKVVLRENTKLVDDLGYDSLSLIHLCVDIEEAFDYEIDDIDMIGELTVGKLQDILFEKLKMR